MVKKPVKTVKESSRYNKDINEMQDKKNPPAHVVVLRSGGYYRVTY